MKYGIHTQEDDWLMRFFSNQPKYAEKVRLDPHEYDSSQRQWKMWSDHHNRWLRLSREEILSIFIYLVKDLVEKDMETFSQEVK